MRLRRSSSMLALAISATCIVFSLPASAQGTAPAASPATPLTLTPSAASPGADTPVEKTQEGQRSDFKSVTLTINPLAIGIGRYSIQGEYMLAPHHALTLNPFFAHIPVKVTVNGQDADLGSLTGFGGEFGYRFYTGDKGGNGFFAGPSLLFASYSQSAPSGSTTTAGSDSFLSYGGAIDVGGQAIIGPGIVVGGGFGLQYTKTSEDINTDNLNLASAVVAGGGIRPRFLFSLGYAF